MFNKEIKLRNGQACTLRQATEDDAQNMLDYLNVICVETDFITFGEGELPWNLEEEQKFIKEHLQDENKLLLIAEVNGSIVSIASFSGGKSKRILHIGELGLTVLKKYWDLGIGFALTDNIIDWAKKSGLVRKVFLKVRVDNERAIKLYAKFGFTYEGTIGRQLLIDNNFYDVYLMGLNIDP